ncbi:MAG: hypothetical protein FWF33_07165, partial [Clostridiales bacterium]|nr:hypothetical protein [Clostridiales bacterium]
ILPSEFMKILGSKLLKNLYSNFVKILPSEFMKKVLAFCKHRRSGVTARQPRGAAESFPKRCNEARRQEPRNV